MKGTFERQMMDDCEQIAIQTFRSYGLSKILPLFHALGFEEQAERFLPLFNTMTADWGEQRMGTTPRWASEVAYDHTPMELSVALNGDRPEIRLLIEPQGNPATLTSSWMAGCQLNARLADQFGTSLERFHQIQDLRAIYEAALAALVERPREAGVGLHSFASFTRHKGHPRTVLYFALEAYKVLSSRTSLTN